MHSDKQGPRGGAGRRARRGGHMTRGPAEAGVVQRFNGPRRGGERHTVYPDREAFYPDYCDASGATPAKSYRELTEGPSASSGASPASSTGVSRTGKSAPQKLYLCPACKQPYDLYDRNGCYVGRVPLVLECFHTACQECIYRRAVGGTAECPECSARSTVPIGLLDNLQAVFLPNYHIVGMVVWHRRGNTNRRAPDIRLVAAGPSVPPSVVSVEEEESFEVMKTCFIEQCGQRAEVRCAECGVDYCAPCSASMHRSVRALSGHQPKMLMRVDPLVLPRCELHNTANEVLCKRCDMKMCIYCFLEEHEGHEKDYLNRLSVEETEEMRRLREDAQVVLEQLQYTQKEIETLMDFDPGAIQTETCSAFASLYARLAAAERRVLSKAEAAAKDASLKAPRGLREAASAASSGAARLRRLLDIDVSGGASANALDAKRLLRELREVKSLPRFLIDAGGGTGSLKPIRFVSKLDIDNLEDKFDVEIGSEADYVLVTEEQLPEDYKMPQISGRRNKMKNKRKKQIEDVTTSGTSSGGEQMNDSSGDSRVKAGKRLDIENERVVVTYIRSMDSVFVQLKKVQGRVDKLTKDIASYVASTGLQWQPLERLQQNDIYLALYETRTQQEWCRGRIIEVRPSGSSDGGAICDVLFVDFGHEQTMAARRLRPLPNQFRLASVPPLAREVRIAAPPGTTWAAGAHLQLGRLVHGRELIVRLVSTPSGINSSPLVDLLLLPPNDRHTADPTSICDLLVYAHDALETQKNKSTPENQQIAPKKIRVRKLKTTSVNEGEDEGVTALERPRVAKAGGSLQKGRCERVEVTSVKDPSRLYVRVLSYAPTFDRLRENMGRYYGQAAAGPQKTPPVVGSFVAAEINETWQRARVDHIDLDTRIAHIYLVDNGADIQVPLAVLRPLREQFSRLAAQAVPVQLADVEPISDTWSDPAVKLLRSYMAPNNTDSLRMIVVEQATENDDNSDKNSDMSIPKVVLLQTSGDNAGDVCVNGRLVAMGFAHAIGPMGEDEYWPSGAVEAPSVVAAKAAEKKAKLEANPTQDDAFVDEMIRKIHEESAVAVAEGYEEDDSPGSAKQPVEVLLVNDPDRIFVCFEMQRETAEKLHRELQVYYNDTDSKAAATNSTATREVNDYCAARCANNVYRRARVLGPSESKKDEESNKYRVYLVDVGQELDMAAEDLFDLDQYFHAFKQIAYGCHMSRIKPAGDTGRWSASASDALRKLLVSRPGVRLAPAGPPDSRDGPSGKIRSLPARFWYPTQSQSASGRYYACAEEALVKLGFAYRLKAKEMSNSAASSKKTDDSVVSSSKWIDLVEMEEKREEIESKSPYRTREVAVNDWLPPFKLQRRDFEAVITCAEIGGGLFLHDEQLHTVYVNLEDKICAYFSATTSNNEVISHWPPGRMCTVRWNDGWYRARVLSSNTPTSIPGTSSFNPSVVHVFMVDFGSDHDVPASDLRPEILFPDVPPFATKVKLEGVKAVSGSWLPQDYDLLMEMLEKAGDRLRVKVVGSMEVAEPSVRVRLPNGRDLAETLAEGSENLTATAAEVSDEEEEVVVEEEEEGESENTVEPVSQQQESVSEETHISSTTESGSVSGSTDEGPTEV